MPLQSTDPHVVGLARFIVIHTGVTVTFITCWPYDVSRKKLATLSLLDVITCCACAVLNAGAVVLLKFAMITSTPLAVAAFVATSSAAAAWRDRIVMRSGVIVALSALMRPCTRTFMPGSSADRVAANRSW